MEFWVSVVSVSEKRLFYKLSHKSNEGVLMLLEFVITLLDLKGLLVDGCHMLVSEIIGCFFCSSPSDEVKELFVKFREFCRLIFQVYYHKASNIFFYCLFLLVYGVIYIFCIQSPIYIGKELRVSVVIELFSLTFHNH